MRLVLQLCAQAFYTKNDSIVNYMNKKLGVKKDLKYLDPCAGDGVLVGVVVRIQAGVEKVVGPPDG